MNISTITSNSEASLPYSAIAQWGRSNFIVPTQAILRNVFSVTFRKKESKK